MSSRAIAIPAGAVIGEPIPIPEGATIGDMPQFKAAPKMFSKDWFKEKFYNGADRGSNALPAVGGMVGGTIGAGSGLLTAGTTSVPGAIGGAALGGGAGEASRQLFRRMMGWEAPQSSLEAAKGIGTEMVKQGIYEAGGQALRVGGKIVAPKLAETAMAPGKRLLKSVPEDVNIGETVLTKTNGVRPKTITKQLQGQIEANSQNLDRMTNQADSSLMGKPATQAPSLKPARDIIGDAVQEAEYRNSPKVRDALIDLQNQLENDVVSGQPLPARVMPSKVRAMKQGVGERISSWNPETQSLPAVQSAKERVYGALDNEFNRSVPGSDAIDKELSQLIPAKEAAWNVSYNPSITRNIFNRVARPTGALAGAGFGAYEGQKQGGTAGAVLGGIAGLTAPELVASPTGQMILARMFGSKWLPRLATNSVRFADAALQPTEEEKQRKKLKQRNPENQ